MKKFKRTLSAVLCSALAGCIALTSAASLATVPVHADNPTVQTAYTPDPAPMVWNDTFYFYTGHDADNASGYVMPDWRCYSTTDMKNWVDHGAVLSYTDFEWAEPDSCWAAQCIERNGKFYFYVTLSSKEAGGARAIGVAVSDSPTGPFKDAIGKPLCGPDWSYIDPTVLIDDDGQAYLYFGNPTLHGVKLKDNMIETDGEIKAFSMTSKHFGECQDGRCGYEEAPWIYKRNGIYYMVYAASGVPETIDYSTSDSPLGSWKYQGRIMDTCPTSFTIHPGIIEYKGHAYYTYHTGDLEGGGGFTRSGAIEEFTFGEDGSIPHIEPTREGPEQLEYFNPYLKNEAETICWESGIKTKKGSDGGIYVTKASGGDYIKVAGVNFAENATSFTASASSVRSDGTIEIRLDSADGKLVGTLNVPKTESEEDWQTLSCDISGADGVHDLYFVFNASSSNGSLSFDWWQFDGVYSEADYAERPVMPAKNSNAKSTVMYVGIAVLAVVIVVIAVVAVINSKKNKKPQDTNN